MEIQLNTKHLPPLPPPLALPPSLPPPIEVIAVILQKAGIATTKARTIIEQALVEKSHTLDIKLTATTNCSCCSDNEEISHLPFSFWALRNTDCSGTYEQ